MSKSKVQMPNVKIDRMLEIGGLSGEVNRHKYAYLVLGIVLLVFVILFFSAWPNKLLQRLLIILMGIFYTLWGMITHTKTDHLTKRVFLEYFGVSVLAVLMLILITI